MKALILIMVSFSVSSLMAKDLNAFDDSYLKTMKGEIKVRDFDQEMKVAYLTRLLGQQQKSYEEKVSFLETELRKTKDRLVEKSMNQEKIEDAMKEKYGTEAARLKKELAYTTKSLLEYQRQIEKMKPSEDLKNMIKLNTELASELRRNEDQIAIIQLKGIEAMPGIHPAGRGMRMPASVTPETNENK